MLHNPCSGHKQNLQLLRFNFERQGKKHKTLICQSTGFVRHLQTGGSFREGPNLRNYQLGPPEPPPKMNNQKNR
eukprot:5750422-Amphidinium_carterae.1